MTDVELPHGADPDRPRLLRLLVEQGASQAELDEANATGALGALALDLALRPGRERVTFADAAERAGLTLDYAARLWRALGFPDPLAGEPPELSRQQATTLTLLSQMAATVFGEETTLQLARVLGGSVAQIAEAIVDAFRISQEMPRRAATRRGRRPGSAWPPDRSSRTGATTTATSSTSPPGS